jgi:hypothetical protein
VRPWPAGDSHFFRLLTADASERLRGEMLYCGSKKPADLERASATEVTTRAGALLGLAILLMIVWAVSFLVYHIAGLLIHVLLVLALIFFVLQLLGGRKI